SLDIVEIIEGASQLRAEVFVEAQIHSGLPPIEPFVFAWKFVRAIRREIQLGVKHRKNARCRERRNSLPDPVLAANRKTIPAKIDVPHQFADGVKRIVESPDLPKEISFGCAA